MPRSVGLLQTVAVSVGVAIGSGIFRVPATVASQLQAPGAILVCWVLGGIIALCGALSVAELAGAMPRSGGIFAYLLEAYGPLPAFLFGWTELVVIRAAALGAIATIFAEYLGYFWPLTPAQVRLCRCARDRAHRRDQLPRRAARRGVAEHHHRAQVRRAAGARPAGLHRNAAAAARTSRLPGAAGSPCRCWRRP